MQISHQNTITILRPIALIISYTFALSGCAPKDNFISTTSKMGESAPTLSIPRSHFPDLTIDNAGNQATQPAAGDSPGNSDGSETTDSSSEQDLFRSAPNPFNPSTEVSFVVPEGGGSVNLTIYGVDGRRVRQLIAADLAGGDNSVIWRGRDDNGRKMPSGVYFASLRTGNEVQIRKLVMVN